MDIPHSPKVANKANYPPQSNTTQAAITDINSLNLQENKVYTARVVKPVHPNPASDPTQKIEPNTTAKNATTKSAPHESHEWFISIKGKLLKISSDKSLQINQILQLKIITDTTTQLKVLAVQLPSTQAPSSATALTAEAKKQTLLNAMNKIITSQVTLEKGLQELLSLSSNANQPRTDKPNGNPTTQQIAQEITALLLKTLPKLNSVLPRKQFNRDEINPPTASSFSTSKPAQPVNNIAHPIKSALQKSGLFFESSFQQPSELTSSNLTPQKQPTTKLEEYSKLLSAVTKHFTKSSQDPYKNEISIEQKHQIKVALSSLKASLMMPPSKPPSSGNSSKTDSKDLTPKDLSSTNPSAKGMDSKIPMQNILPGQDLKSMLLALTSILSKTHSTLPSQFGINTQTSVELSLTNRLLGLTQLDLLQTPFNFPNLSIQQTLKSRSLITEKELTTGQILKLLASMIHRIQFNQLNSLYQSQSASPDTPSTQSWFIELPFLTPQNQVNTFNFRLDKNAPDSSKRKDSDKQTIKWTLSLSFDLERLGPMYIQVNLTPPNASSTIWADNEHTLSLIQKESVHFKSRLQDLGLSVENIFCHKGPPAQKQTKLDRNLVDIEA